VADARPADLGLPALLEALDLDPGPETEALARQALEEIARAQKFPMRRFGGR